VAGFTKKRSIPDLGEKTIAPNDEVHFDIVAVGGRVIGKDEKFGSDSDPNSFSIAMAVHFGTFDYFIGGDLPGGGNSTTDIESQVASTVGDVDVLRVNHHGSNTASNSRFIKMLKPEQVVISVGNGRKNKIYHLPNVKVVNRLYSEPSIQNIFQTEKGEGYADGTILEKTRVVGDVIIIADPYSYIINGQKFPTDGIEGVRR
jgi:beta-lactamase superfamily II metal-dependent hydrolase